MLWICCGPAFLFGKKFPQSSLLFLSVVRTHFFVWCEMYKNVIARSKATWKSPLFFLVENGIRETESIAIVDTSTYLG